MKKTKAISIIGFIALIAAMMVMPAAATTWDVYPGQSIQSAIGNASSGDTIFVHAGTYELTDSVGDWRLRVYTPHITLKGEGADKVTLDLMGKSGIYIGVGMDESFTPAPGCVVEGFRVINGNSGVWVANEESPNCTIRNNVIEVSNSGVGTFASNTTIRGNVISNITSPGDWVLRIDTKSCTIDNNTFTNNPATYAVIYFNDIGTPVPNTIITNNTITNNGPAAAILFVGDWSSGSIVARNNISYNDKAFWFYYGSPSGNKMYLNDVVGNTANVVFTDTSTPTNIWNSTEQIEYVYGGTTYTNHLGNYWSPQYTGSDGDGDGIGDTDYDIPGSATDKDYRPLMAGFENYLGAPAAEPPHLVTYTISTHTITPPQTTEIDVEFSEEVEAWISIEDSDRNLVNELYHNAAVTNPAPKPWDGTYENDTVVPAGDYYVNVTGTNTTTGLSVVNNTEVITVVTITEQPDLNVTAIDINADCVNVTDEIFVNESNEICAVVHNDGPGDVTEPFDVCFYDDANGVAIGSETVTGGLAAGANTTVCIYWTPDCTDYHIVPVYPASPISAKINVTADCNNAIEEVDETNNTLLKDTAVYSNGYKSKNFGCDASPLELFEYEEMFGGVVYNMSGTKNYPFDPDETDIRVHSIGIPDGMTVKKARLYVYWYDYWTNPSPGILPDLAVSINGITYTTPDRAYNDQKGFGTYNTPKGTYAYDVTSQVTGSGDYTVTVKNIGASKTTLLGEMLLVVYEDAARNPSNWMKLWLMEGCDYLMAADATHGKYDYCVSVEEATAIVTFPGDVDTANLNSAELITVVSQGQEDGANKLVNGNLAKANAWNEITASEVNVDAEDVSAFLVASNNTLGFEDTGTKGMQASNAILVVREEAPSNVVYFVPKDSGATYCNTTEVTLMADIDESIAVTAADVDIVFNKDCVDVAGWVRNDTVWPSGTFTDYRTGHIKITTAVGTNPPVNGSLPLGTLTLHCNNTEYCKTSLEFTYAHYTVAAGFGPSIDPATQNGTFRCENLPDLVITEAYGEPINDTHYKVKYTVKNEGNANAASGHSSTLLIDGEIVEHKPVPVELTPGATYDGTFDSEIAISGETDEIKVCADNYDAVMELDEKNNCKRQFYPAGVEIGIEFSPSNETAVAPGEQFTANVTVEPRPGVSVYGVEYVISFNSSVVHAEWQNEGEFLKQGGASTNVYINKIDNSAGTIKFAVTRTGTTAGATAKGTLARIAFTALEQQGACSDLVFSSVKMSDPGAEPIEPVDVVNGKVCIIENEQPVPVGKSMHTYNNVGEKYLSKTYFNGSLSYDPDGGITYYRWAFGDGTYGTGATVDHIYDSWHWNGASSSYDQFIVSLTVEDDGTPIMDNTTSFPVNVFIAGDANGDGIVDIFDAVIVGLEWDNECTCGDYCWEGEPRADKADLNNDKIVDIFDAVIVGANWDHTAW
jgi:hypothetical protein